MLYELIRLFDDWQWTLWLLTTSTSASTSKSNSTSTSTAAFTNDSSSTSPASNFAVDLCCGCRCGRTYLNKRFMCLFHFVLIFFWLVFDMAAMPFSCNGLMLCCTLMFFNIFASCSVPYKLLKTAISYNVIIACLSFVDIYLQLGV